MNIISYNGRGVKWAAIRRMVRKEQADMLCIQETKKENIDKSLCRALWGDNDVQWEMQPTSNTAGGILVLWNEKAFNLQSKVIGTGSFCCLVNGLRRLNMYTLSPSTHPVKFRIREHYGTTSSS